MQNNRFYEFPLNERMRIFLRLESCYAQIQHFLAQDTIWDNKAGLLVLIEILNIIEKHNIKNEVSKELERCLNTLNNLTDISDINISMLESILGNINEHLSILRQLDRKLCNTARESDFLNNIRQRLIVSTQISNFELPGLHHWLNHRTVKPAEQIYTWMTEITPCLEAIGFVLQLIRGSGDFNPYTASSGFFQKNFNSINNCQIIRLSLQDSGDYFPEISGNRHRISIRFLKYENYQQRPIPMVEDISFKLSCCSI